MCVKRSALRRPCGPSFNTMYVTRTCAILGRETTASPHSNLAWNALQSVLLLALATHASSIATNRDLQTKAPALGTMYQQLQLYTFMLRCDFDDLTTLRQIEACLAGPSQTLPIQHVPLCAKSKHAKSKHAAPYHSKALPLKGCGHCSARARRRQPGG